MSGESLSQSIWLALLQGLNRYGLWAAIVFGSMGVSDCFAVEPPFEYLNVNVETITYQGNDNYRVAITVNNRSDKTLALKEINGTFYVQTEIPGHWEKLSASPCPGDESILLLPLKGLQRAYLLNIPLNIPRLYTNSYGDINMVFKYLIQFLPAAGSAIRRNSGESAYWITPKTSTWVLREGM